MKKLLLILGLMASCSLEPNSQKEKIVKIDPTKQKQYAQEWAELTEKYSLNNKFFGSPDIWGDGDIPMYLWFQEGELWDEFETMVGKYILHRLVGNSSDDPNYLSGVPRFEHSFVNGYTAVVYMLTSASPKLAGAVYVLQITNNKLYRTRSEKGFTHLKNWDGLNVNIADMIEIGQVIDSEEEPVLPPVDQMISTNWVVQQIEREISLVDAMIDENNRLQCGKEFSEKETVTPHFEFEQQNGKFNLVIYRERDIKDIEMSGWIFECLESYIISAQATNVNFFPLWSDKKCHNYNITIRRVITTNEKSILI